jgi:hypothetical protein
MFSVLERSILYLPAACIVLLPRLTLKKSSQGLLRGRAGPEVVSGQLALLLAANFLPFSVMKLSLLPCTHQSACEVSIVHIWELGA